MKVVIFLLAVAVCRGAVLQRSERNPTQDIKNKEPLQVILNAASIVEQDVPKLSRDDKVRLVELLKDVEKRNIDRKELVLERPFLIKYVDKMDNADEENRREPMEIRVLLENKGMKKTANELDERVTDELDAYLARQRQSQRLQNEVQKMNGKQKLRKYFEDFVEQPEKETKVEEKYRFQKDLKDSKEQYVDQTQKRELKKVEHENPLIVEHVEDREQSRMHEEIEKMLKEQYPSKERDRSEKAFEDQQSQTQKTVKRILKETNELVKDTEGEKVQDGEESRIREIKLSKDKPLSLKDLEKMEASEQHSPSWKKQEVIEEIVARKDPSRSELSLEKVKISVQGKNLVHERPSPLFPMGEMVTDMMLEQYHWYKILVAEDVKDFTGLSNAFLTEIVTSVPKVTREVRSPTTLTVLYLKAVMEEVLNERLKCPSVVMDKVLIRMARKSLNEIQPDYDHYMYMYMSMLLSGYLERTEMEQIVLKGYKQLHNEMSYKLMHYIVSRHLKDVYSMSQRLYTDFQTFFEKYINSTSTDVNQLAMLIKTATKSCDVKCPVGTYLDNTNKYVHWDLVHQFIPAEGTSITDRLESLIYREVFYVYAKKNQPFPEGLYRLMGLKMHPTTVDRIERYIAMVSTMIARYEQMLVTKDATPFLQYIDFIVDPSETTVIKDVMKTLGWKMHPDSSQMFQQQKFDHHVSRRI